MSDPIDAVAQLDAIIARYRAELVRLNYVRGSINGFDFFTRTRACARASKKSHQRFTREPAPGTQQRAGVLTEAWVKTGAACP
jgi:hypothetical protein